MLFIPAAVCATFMVHVVMKFRMMLRSRVCSVVCPDDARNSQRPYVRIRCWIFKVESGFPMHRAGFSGMRAAGESISFCNYIGMIL